MSKKQKFGNILQFATEDTQLASFNGSTYRKQIAKFGQWVNPDYPWFSDDPHMSLDENWAATIVKNFDEGNLGSPVPVPLNHTDDVRVNTGMVKSLEIVKSDGLYAELEIMDEDTIDNLDKGLIFDVSISFQWDYISQKDGTHYGATLLHVALVNTPYLIGMNSFEKVGNALSKLNDSLKGVGLAHQSDNAIMLSRAKIKELSTVEDATIKNTSDVDVTINVTRDGAEVEEVIKAGEEVVVPTDQAEDIAQQIQDAGAEQPAEEAGETADDTSEESTDDKPEDQSTDEDAEQSEDDDAAGETEAPSELSKAMLENSELKLSAAYDKLLSAGKVIPAQKEAIMGLSKLTGGVELSTATGTKIDLAKVVLDILEAGSQQFSTDEEGTSAEDETSEDAEDKTSDEDKKPSEQLSEAELAGMKAVGADPAKLDEMAQSDPRFAEALNNLTTKGKK